MNLAISALAAPAPGAAAREACGGEVEVAVNAADGETADSVYLTVTGLSAEAGDDGQVGRGNRVNGLITPYRPMSLEAAAGKNPVSHLPSPEPHRLAGERAAARRRRAARRGRPVARGPRGAVRDRLGARVGGDH